MVLGALMKHTPTGFVYLSPNLSIKVAILKFTREDRINEEYELIFDCQLHRRLLTHIKENAITHAPLF